MIDTDKYEGHTEGPWRIVCWERQWYIEGDYEEGQEDCTASDVCHLYGTAQRKDPTARLIADAPLLLAEVERFRRMCLNDMVCYDCLSDLYKAGLSDENPVDAYWCGMCCEPMKGLVE